VSREIFEKRHEAQWAALDMSLSRLEGGRAARSVSGSSVPADLPELYRQVCHHLALVRHRRYGADLELRLNRLAGLRGIFFDTSVLIAERAVSWQLPQRPV
jgi:hypothetical protein